MTTITFRDNKLPHVAHHDHSLSAYARKVARAWHQWQAAREIEAMPIDMRKDFGWPSADNVDDHKAM
ncbi:MULTISPECIES: hypothetical protein [unclassified Rhizobium]|jgi:hypothetical protein|uniref:hypothetical protein n=1 Tax=unclassified Rhizobium TaxID=2613769 RepID=UPI000DB9456B|nr:MULTISPECIES: hypothetical protein [unclassified Rhizobium]MBO9194560.1 hypothetical protein [Rhizobium sp. 16-449-1b]